MMTMDAPGTSDLFENAPPLGLQRRLGLIKPDALNIERRALLVIAVGWLPIIVLTIVQSLVLWSDQITSLFREVGGHARYLIAAPLLVLAERECAPWLCSIHFSSVPNRTTNSRSPAIDPPSDRLAMLP